MCVRRNCIASNLKDRPVVQIFLRTGLLNGEIERSVRDVPQGAVLAAVALISSTIPVRASENSRGRKAAAPKHSAPTLRIGTHQQPTSTGNA